MKLKITIILSVIAIYIGFGNQIVGMEKNKQFSILEENQNPQSLEDMLGMFLKYLKNITTILSPEDFLTFKEWNNTFNNLSSSQEPSDKINLLKQQIMEELPKKLNPNYSYQLHDASPLMQKFFQEISTEKNQNSDSDNQKITVQLYFERVQREEQRSKILRILSEYLNNSKINFIEKKENDLIFLFCDNILKKIDSQKLECNIEDTPYIHKILSVIHSIPNNQSQIAQSTWLQALLRQAENFDPSGLFLKRRTQIVERKIVEKKNTPQKEQKPTFLAGVKNFLGFANKTENVQKNKQDPNHLNVGLQMFLAQELEKILSSLQDLVNTRYKDNPQEFFTKNFLSLLKINNDLLDHENILDIDNAALNQKNLELMKSIVLMLTRKNKPYQFKTGENFSKLFGKILQSSGFINGQSENVLAFDQEGIDAYVKQDFDLKHITNYIVVPFGKIFRDENSPIKYGSDDALRYFLSPTNPMGAVFQAVKIKELNPKDVLYVFDVDGTLITGNTGSTKFRGANNKNQTEPSNFTDRSQIVAAIDNTNIPWGIITLRYLFLKEKNKIHEGVSNLLSNLKGMTNLKNFPLGQKYEPNEKDQNIDKGQYKNIYSSFGDLKSNFLSNMIKGHHEKYAQYPQYVIFMDDKDAMIEDMIQACQENGSLWKYAQAGVKFIFVHCVKKTTNYRENQESNIQDEFNYLNRNNNK